MLDLSKPLVLSPAECAVIRWAIQKGKVAILTFGRLDTTGMTEPVAPSSTPGDDRTQAPLETGGGVANT